MRKKKLFDFNSVRETLANADDIYVKYSQDRLSTQLFTGLWSVSMKTSTTFRRTETAQWYTYNKGEKIVFFFFCNILIRTRIAANTVVSTPVDELNKKKKRKKVYNEEKTDEKNDFS